TPGRCPLAPVSTSSPPRPGDAPAEPTATAPHGPAGGLTPSLPPETTGPPSATRPRPGAFSALPALALGAPLRAAWQLAAQTHALPAYLVPIPGDVLAAFQHALASGLFVSYAGWTLAESFAGFALGALIALPMGYAIARSRILARLLEPYLAASQ